MCSFIDAFKHLLLRKTKILKTWLKGKYLGNKIWRNSFEEQKGTMYIWENLYFGIIIFSCHPSTKPCLRFMLNCFAQEIKGFHQSSLGNEVNYRDIMNVSPNILAKNYNFKKLRHGFVDERALITTTSISSCHWKTLALFCLQNKTLENAFLTLIVNYREIEQKNKFCHDIWCYFVIDCFDWKNGTFQQTVLRGLLYP